MNNWKNLTNYVIVFLLLVLLFRTCRNPYPISSPKIIRDTTWIYKDSVVYSKPQIIKSIPAVSTKEYYTKEYLPDTNYQKLLSQYREVVNKLLTQNIYSDSIKIDTTGYAYITDTISQNHILGRSLSYSIKYPIIKETIILPEKKRNQLYVGFSVLGQPLPLNSLNAELLLKNKADNIFGASIGITSDSKLQYGIRYYTKIKLKKNG
jgi:hypothetical protein